MNSLEEIFSSPLVVKYLQTIFWNNLVDEVNIPLDTFLAEPDKHKLRVAFLKGSSSILQTLLSISTNRAKRLAAQAKDQRNESPT
jgi:hypothetical protein